MTSRTLDIATRIAPDLIALRRTLHQAPEMGLRLPLTQQAVLAELEGLDVEVTLGESLDSVVVVLRGGAAAADHRPAVLLRGDMDGLPVTELVDVPYASTNGVMHACGHDLHVAALVGAVRILHEQRADLAGDVVFMFQPAEEGPGGAEPMLAEGLLEASGTRVSAAYSMHVVSGQHPYGTWWGRPGPLMAAADEVMIEVHGRGGHGSIPHLALDPVPVACEIVLALHQMVTRTFDVFDPVMVTVGKVAAGTKENIIPDNASIAATVRTLSTANREAMQERITRLAEGIASAHGLTASVEYGFGYPVTENNPAEFEHAREVVVDLFGEGRWVDMANPELGAEDMSYVLNEVPGAYLFVSACVGDPDQADANHSPRATFDDTVVPDAAAFLAEAALRRLRGLSDTP